MISFKEIFFTTKLHWAVFLFLTTLFFCLSCESSAPKYKSWEVYGGSKENIRYSALTQIDTSNVKKLNPVWEFKTQDHEKFTQIQANPIVIDTVLYGVSPKLKLFALNAKTSKKPNKLKG